MLPPSKINGNYNYGMRISAISDRFSTSSRNSVTEYDIWRRWEDCLTFQGTIEDQYKRMAREKRTGLLRGKGVKTKDGFYKQDIASSWESLPPGPDPNSVGRHIHQYIPALTKKATVFRASQATVDQRAAELSIFIHELWKDDVPALINELRNDHVVTDFFGYWRRDHEIAEKQRKQKTIASTSRTSVTSSIFSMYFSSSNPSINNLNKYPESIATSRSASTFRTSRQSTPSPTSEAPRNRKASTSSTESSSLTSERSSGRRRAYSTGSSNFSTSTPSDSSLDSPVQLNIPVPAIADDVPTLSFDHNPLSSDHAPQWQSSYIQDRSLSALAVLPEGREVCLKTDRRHNPPPVTRRRGDTNPDRHGRIFLSPPPPPDVPSPIEESEQDLLSLQAFLSLPNEPSIRESWQSTDSAMCILEGINMAMPLTPSSPTETYSSRASMNSIATFRTNVSTDGVLPRAQHARPSPTPILTPRSRIVSGPVSISEFDNEWSDEGDILDSFLADSFPIPDFEIPHMEIPRVLADSPLPESYPATPQVPPSRSVELPPSLPSSPISSIKSSPAKSTTFSMATQSSTMPNQLTIKAKFNDSAIILRVAEEIPYKELRQRLFNKFVGQEGVPLSDKFRIDFHHIQSDPNDPAVETTILYTVKSQDDWGNVASSIQGNKLTFQIYDDTP